MSQQGSAGNVLAAICNIFIVGLGQLIQGRVLAAIIFCAVTYVLYFTWIFWFVGVVFHLWAIIDAARFKSSTQ